MGTSSQPEQGQYHLPQQMGCSQSSGSSVALLCVSSLMRGRWPPFCKRNNCRRGPDKNEAGYLTPLHLIQREIQDPYYVVPKHLAECRCPPPPRNPTAPFYLVFGICSSSAVLFSLSSSELTLAESLTLRPRFQHPALLMFPREPKGPA